MRGSIAMRTIRSVYMRVGRFLYPFPEHGKISAFLMGVCLIIFMILLNSGSFPVRGGGMFYGTDAFIFNSLATFYFSNYFLYTCFLCRDEDRKRFAIRDGKALKRSNRKLRKQSRKK